VLSREEALALVAELADVQGRLERLRGALREVLGDLERVGGQQAARPERVTGNMACSAFVRCRRGFRPFVCASRRSSSAKGRDRHGLAMSV
jgi:hypothetical protein